MKHFKIRGVLQKIIIMPILVVLLSFSVPNYAAASGGVISTMGGMLTGPIAEFVASIFDAIIFGLDGMFYNEKTIMDGIGVVGGILTTPIGGDSLPDAGQTDKYYGPIEEGDVTSVIEYSENIDKGVLQWVVNPDNYSVPVINLSPKEIFSNEIPALDVNFIQTPKYDGQEGFEERAVTSYLHDTIATWYVSLRNLAIIGLLSILLYVGIRMMLTSLAAEKAKYKQMFMDWLIALCLIFFLHYIMSFTLTITEAITSAIASSVTDVNVYVLEGEEPSGTGDSGEATSQNREVETEFSTNLTGLARFRVQYESFGARWFNLLLYIALVILTVMFLYTYVKRVIMMAFLTLIAPLVCMTYPLDKIGDGKAQAFNMWLREFIYNALLQPFHLLLYAIFIGSAMDLAATNWFYAIVCLVFIFEAEKILKKMFGFEKGGLGTIGTLGGFAGGAIAAEAFGKLGNIGGKSKTSSSGGGAPTLATSKNKTKSTDFSAYDGQLPAERPIATDATQIRENIQTTASTDNINTQNRNQEFQDRVESNNNAIRLQENVPTDNGYAYVGENHELEEEQRHAFNDYSRGVPLQKDKNGYFKDSLSGIHALAQSKIRGKQRKTVIKGVAKKAAKAYFTGGLAVAGAVGGAAAGIATGDLDNVFKMGAAGLAAGSAGGKALPDAFLAKKRESIKKFQENVERPYYEGIYGEKGAKKIISRKQFFENEDNWNYFREEFKNDDGSYKSSKEIQSIMSNAFEYTEKGINDLDDIKSGVQLEQEKKEQEYRRIEQQLPGEQNKQERMKQKRAAAKKARQQAIFATQWYKTRMSPSDLGDVQKMASRQNYLADEFRQRGVSEEDAQQQARAVMNDIRTLYRG